MRRDEMDSRIRRLMLHFPRFRSGDPRNYNRLAHPFARHILSNMPHLSDQEVLEILREKYDITPTTQPVTN